MFSQSRATASAVYLISLFATIYAAFEVLVFVLFSAAHYKRYPISSLICLEHGLFADCLCALLAGWVHAQIQIALIVIGLIVIQFCSLAWYIASYVPFGRSCLAGFSGLSGRLFRRTIGV